jgi:hypothetical protein
MIKKDNIKMNATGVFWMIKGNWKGLGFLYIGNFYII